MSTWIKLAEYDNVLREKYGSTVCGVDETGRGSFAGPIVGGACILPADASLPGLNDSKKMTAEARHKLAADIKSIALGWGVYAIEAKDIDKKGLTWANRHCMSGAAEKAKEMFGGEVNLYVIDQSPECGLQPHIMMPKADGTSLSVAAASVLAKTWRDEHMVNLAKIYKEYSLDTHKGYINDVHKQAVLKHGLVEGLHRFSYKVTGVNKPHQTSFDDLF